MISLSSHKNLWLFLFSFWLLSYFLQSHHYSSSSTIHLKSCNASFLLLSTCVHCPPTCIGHCDSSTCCHIWETFLISSEHCNQCFFITSRFMTNDLLIYDLLFVNVLMVTFLIYDVLSIDVLLMFWLLCFRVFICLVFLVHGFPSTFLFTRFLLRVKK
jgi:hypothetical protein